MKGQPVVLEPHAPALAPGLVPDLVLRTLREIEDPLARAQAIQSTRALLMDERTAAVVAALESGDSHTRVAAALGCTESLIRQLQRRHNQEVAAQ